MFQAIDEAGPSETHAEGNEVERDISSEQTDTLYLEIIAVVDYELYKYKKLIFTNFVNISNQ